LTQVNVLMPNEVEAAAISGVTDPKAALGALARQVPVVAVKLGPEGAIAQQGNKVVRAAPPAVHVRDTTGAGDSFDAGFVYGYLAGWPLERTLRLACACGALATRVPGGTNGQPTLPEALAAVNSASGKQETTG
jgi:sugar/nucleoside kinase (ribokinase family)